jgi:hypothetical protein
VFVLDDLPEAWHTNNRINLYLIDHISDAGMSCSLSRHGGRGVAGQFAHIPVSARRTPGARCAATARDGNVAT